MKALCNILRQVHEFSWSLWESGQTVSGSAIDNRANATYDSLARTADHYPLEPEPLDGRLRTSERSHDLRLYFNHGTRFYLPPLDENCEFVATLSLDCKLSEPNRSFKFRIEMYTLREQQLHGIGYRFEFGEGEHKHAHVTLAKERPDSEGGKALFGCPIWLPTYIPRVPTIAGTPVSLLVCMLIGLYGKKGYARLLTDPPDNKYLRGLEALLSG